MDSNETSVILWCQYGPCKHEKMNVGEVGATAQEAYEKLVKLNDAWVKERFNRGIELTTYGKPAPKPL